MDATDSGRNPVEELAEEFIERQRRGETPSVEEYALKFPHHAEAIRELFPALLMMEKLGAEDDFFSDEESNPAMRPSARLEHIGDFRILREVGRGGMGVVYEAEQESLGRRVALKVLSAHSRFNNGHVQRFDREARSAARLHHTNIVPVFGVGQQDGLHYYVMQFIQGQGLDEVLTELKRLRAVAPHGAQAVADAARIAPGAERSAARQVAESLLTGEFRIGTIPDDASHGTSSVAGAEAGRDQPDLCQNALLASDAPVVALPGHRRCGASCPEQPVLRGSAPATADEEQAGGTPAPHPRDRAADSSVTLPGQSEFSTVVKSQYQYARSVARIGIQVGGALEYANTQGIVHRDIKPSNLLLDLKGTVWVTDFGLAKSSEAGDLTHTGDIVGTLRYMAPERFRGRCDARADVYSLGLTLYELLALRPAYDEEDRQRLIQLVTQEPPLRLERLNPAVPRDLATIVQKAIEPEPEHRYATAGALADDLQRFIDDKPIRARHIRPHERLLRWSHRNRGLAALTVAVLVLLVVIAGISSVAAVHLRRALGDTQAAQSDTSDKLWIAYLAQARAGRLTRQPGQRPRRQRSRRDREPPNSVNLLKFFSAPVAQGLPFPGIGIAEGKGRPNQHFPNDDGSWPPGRKRPAFGKSTCERTCIMWFKAFVASSKSRPSQSRRSQTRQPRRGPRLNLEQLESRTVLSAYSAANVAHLIADINAANKAGGTNTIVLSAPTTSPYILTKADNSTDGPTGLPVIAANDNLTIVGNGDTIERGGSGYFRLLDVAAGASLTLDNLTLKGGFALGVQGKTNVWAEGGAVYNQGALALNGVTVEDNWAEGYSSSGAHDPNPEPAFGGGIYSNGMLTLEGGTVSGNVAQGGSDLATNLDTNDFRSGGAGLGGAVYIVGGTASLSDATLSGNTAEGGGGWGLSSGAGIGGALDVAAGTVTLSGDILALNTAAGGHSNFSAGGSGVGGALAINGGAAGLTNVTLTGNGAVGGSGTLHPPGNGTGGALAIIGGRVTLTSAALTDNFAQGLHSDGGAIYVQGGVLTLTTSLISDNTALTPGSEGGLGGGIFIGSGATVYIDSSTLANVVNNTAVRYPNICGQYIET